MAFYNSDNLLLLLLLAVAAPLQLYGSTMKTKTTHGTKRHPTDTSDYANDLFDPSPPPPPPSSSSSHSTTPHSNAHSSSSPPRHTKPISAESLRGGGGGTMSSSNNVHPNGSPSLPKKGALKPAVSGSSGGPSTGPGATKPLSNSPAAAPPPPPPGFPPSMKSAKSRSPYDDFWTDEDPRMGFDDPSMDPYSFSSSPNSKRRSSFSSFSSSSMGPGPKDDPNLPDPDKLGKRHADPNGRRELQRSRTYPFYPGMDQEQFGMYPPAWNDMDPYSGADGGGGGFGEFDDGRYGPPQQDLPWGRYFDDMRAQYYPEMDNGMDPEWQQRQNGGFGAEGAPGAGTLGAGGKGKAKGTDGMTRGANGMVAGGTGGMVKGPPGDKKGKVGASPPTAPTTPSAPTPPANQKTPRDANIGYEQDFQWY